MTAGYPSIVNILMLYLSLLGIGAMGGYATFYFSFSQRCSAHILASESRHNESRQAFQEKYEAAIEGQLQCMSGSIAKDEVNQIQGRLESQSTLADRHQSLLDKHEATLERLSALQQSNHESGSMIHELREQLAVTRTELATTKQKLEAESTDAKIMIADLTTRLVEAQTLVEHQEQQIQTLTLTTTEHGSIMPVIKEQFNFLKNYVRQRNHAKCKMEYGHGPFMVEFTLSFPISMSAEGPTTFTVELAPVTDMPHTVVTFLDLVDLQLFDGTAFVSANSQQIEGGSPNHADVSRSVKLYETYARYGYTRTPLGFNEYSEKHPHAPFTIGFAGYPHAGPGLAINMADNTKSRGPDSDGMGGQPCFGTIISGFDTLTRIQSAPKSVDGYRFAKNVEIKSVRLVQVANNFGS